ncbi:hypothetical protein ACFL3S_10375 [Gemmatimonadota bacterium]
MSHGRKDSGPWFWGAATSGDQLLVTDLVVGHRTGGEWYLIANLLAIAA